nr:retrovirus-related Pol polyprotein from transposon TNT 1-94 [Tanacetum cinerariifolium]
YSGKCGSKGYRSTSKNPIVFRGLCTSLLYKPKDGYSGKCGSKGYRSTSKNPIVFRGLCTSLLYKPKDEPKIKQFPNSTSLLDRNDHVAVILDFGDLQWGNILITRVYFVEGLGHNLFSIRQFCDSDLEVAFRRNACFVKNLEGVDLLKGNRSTNLYTINLLEIASASPICLMAHASSTKSWLWRQRLSHLNFDTINDLARNDLVAGLPKFKYHKEHLCPSCEQGKSKKASHPPKPVLNSRQKLHLLYMDLCGPIRIASINGKQYILVIVDDYSRYTCVHFLRSKDEAPDVIIKFLKRITVLLQNLEGVDLLKGDRSTNLYTIHLHEMASVSPICLMARASSTKSWLWHQRLSHLNFDTTNDLARNDLVAGLPKFKYHKEHLCPSCEQGKSKRASPPPKPVPNLRQRLHLLHMDLYRPMRIASINEAARTMLIFSRASLFLSVEAIATACFTQNRSIIHRRFNKTPYELINGRKPNISFLHVFGALCYPKNDHEDIGKLGVKGDIGFFIGYSANSCAYRIYNRRTKKIMETMNVSFDELSAMAFEQRSSKPRLQCMTSGQTSSGLDLTYASSTIMMQQPTEGELDLLFEAMYDDYFGGQPSANVENVPPAQEPQVRLPKSKYQKEHLCPSCEQGKSKRASHPPKPVPNLRQRLHLLHMDLCGPMRITSINGKRYILVIVDDYSRYTWVHFLRSKDEAPVVIITFLKRITVLLQSPVVIIRTDNGTEFKNQVLKVYFDSVSISHQMSSV